MGHGLCILLALCMITLCHSLCIVEKKWHIGYRPRTHKVYGEHPIGCKNNGVFYKVGEAWKTHDCQTCTCEVDSVTCCIGYSTPYDYDKVHCEAILDKNTCTYKVLKKNDHTQTCEFSSSVS